VEPRGAPPYTGGTLPLRQTMTTQKTVLSIDGMTCGHCVKGLEQALAALPGVKKVTVELATGAATVVHEGTQEATITQAVVDEGYDVRSVLTR